MRARAAAVAGRLMASHECWPCYTEDLCLEALLNLYSATGDAGYLEHVHAVWKFRGNPRTSLLIGNAYFTNIHLETCRHTGDMRFVEGMVDLANEWRRTAPRTREGIVGHLGEPRGAVLLDMLAGYAPLMAAAGTLSGDKTFHEECVQQIQLHRDILRDPATGLWHHARGWLAPGSLSPSGWCRGQGWAMRAIVKSLEWMSAPEIRAPDGSRGNDAGCHVLLEILNELAAALLLHQQPSGLWHQLADDPDSYPETSGSGFVVRALQVAGLNRWFDAADAVARGISALESFVTPDGTVGNGCPGTPPMALREDYRKRGPGSGDPHAAAAVLMALSGAEP